VRTIRLPEGVEWSRAVATSAGFYIAGYRSRELVLVRGAWNPRDEELTLVSWQSRVLSGAPLLLSVDEAASPAVRLFLIGGPPLPPRSLPPTRTFTNFGSVETPGWLGDDSRGMDSAGGVTWVIDATLTLKGFSREGVPVVNRTLVPSIHELQQLAEGAPPFLPVPMHAREGSVHLGIGSHLIGVNRVDQHYALAAAGQIRSIVGSASFTRPRLAVFLDDAGGFVFWPTFHGGTHQPLPEDLIDARGVFLRDGRLLVYTADTWSLYLTQHGRLHLDREMSAPEADVHEMLATPTAGQFAACSRRGSLAVYEADR
jgi:hypothetical protein